MDSENVLWGQTGCLAIRIVGYGAVCFIVAGWFVLYKNGCKDTTKIAYMQILERFFEKIKIKKDLAPCVVVTQ
jgi:hypothetical protein